MQGQITITITIEGQTITAELNGQIATMGPACNWINRYRYTDEHARNQVENPSAWWHPYAIAINEAKYAAVKAHVLGGKTALKA